MDFEEGQEEAAEGARPPWDKETLKEWFGKLIALDEDMRNRMYIVQLAEVKGWTLAKAVAQRKAGKLLDEDVQYVYFVVKGYFGLI